MARLTLNPLITSISGHLSNANFRAAAGSSLLVLPPIFRKPPTAAQLKRRAAWQRLELLIKDLSPEYKACMEYEADAAGIDLHRWYIAKHLSDETQYGYSALCPPNDFPPPVEGLNAVTGPAAGWIVVNYTPLAPGAPFTIGSTLRKVPAPGEPALTTRAQQNFPGPESDVGVLLITDLGFSKLYSLSVHFIPHMLYRTGASSSQLEVMSGS